MTCTHPNARWRQGPCPDCGTEKPVSPTEVSTARGCDRLHGFKYHSDIPRPPPKPSAALGTELHKHAEAWLRDGAAPPVEGIGVLLRDGLKHLPAPGVPAVEALLQPTIDGIPFLGYADFLCSSSDAPGFPEQGLALVGDHKTSSAPRRYGVWTLEDRLDDPQTLVYLSALRGERRAARWVYYPTKGRSRVSVSDCVLTERQIRGGVERVVLPIAEHVFRRRRQQIDPNDLEPNFGHCNAYGGCDYLQHCHRSPAAFARHVFSGKGAIPMANIWDEIGVNGKSEAPAATPAPAAPATFNFGDTATPAPAAPATFNFGGTAAPAPVETEPEPERKAAAAPEPEEKPKRRRKAVAAAKAAKAEQATVESTGTGTSLGSDTLARIGRALIAAGRALAGE